MIYALGVFRQGEVNLHLGDSPIQDSGERLALVILTVAVGLGKFKTAIANWLAFLGENSLLIMCIHYPLISLVYNISLPGLRYYYSLIGNSTLPTEAIEAGCICNLLTLIILVPLSLYIGLLIKKIFPFCFAKR